MLRYCLLSIALVLTAQSAFADQAGKIVFVAGATHVAGKAGVLGAPVNEGDMLDTGADGYIYVKTIDSGLFILRPSTKARIAVYHVDEQHPENNRFKLELLSGIARSRSGDAVKLAKQNFRFNTPVAAIGVRGTDFTVFTDQETSRVAVVSGGIVVSPFGASCRPEGGGPCEGSLTRELSAAQKGQLLQIQRGQNAPQLLQGGNLTPDVLAPPRTDEPIGKNSGSANATLVAVGEPSLDPQKLITLQGQVQSVPLTAPSKGSSTVVDTTPPAVTAPVNPVPPSDPVVVTDPVAPVTPVTPVTPPREISWGRYAVVLNQPAATTLSKDGAQRIGINEYFALFESTSGLAYVAPTHGSVGLSMDASEAYVKDQATQAVTAATLSNGQLLLNFDKASFSTSFDLLNQKTSYNLMATGQISSAGRLFGDGQYYNNNTMTVSSGLLGGDGTAAYLFQAQLDQNKPKTVYGVTHWAK